MKNSYLFELAAKGDRVGLEHLHAFGADLTVDNFRALLLAVKNLRYETVEYLTEFGGSTQALEYALWTKDYTMIDMLMTPDNLTQVLPEVVAGGDLTLVEYMIAKGATISTKALETAVVSGHLPIVESFVEKGAAITKNLLKEAIQKKRIDITRYLLNRGGDPLIALKAATKSNSLELLEYLLHTYTYSEDNLQLAYRKSQGSFAARLLTQLEQKYLISV